MPRNPFELPEIRGRLARFVSVNDAISCMQVSKAFSEDFAYPIWHTINFGTQKFQLNPATLNKYGQYIRVVTGVSGQSHLNALMELRATKLSVLEVWTTMNTLFQATLYDIIRQNQATLTRLNIVTNKQRSPSNFIFLDSLTSMTDSHQPSKLTTLTIQRLTLTRGSLISILRCCPALETIDLWETTLIASRNFDDYQHARVNRLSAYITDAFGNGDPPLFATDASDDGNPPLLVHFPKLTWLDTYYDSSLSAFPTQKVKDTVSRWCPNLNYLGANHTPAPMLSHLVANVFFGLSGLVFSYDNISPDVILALLCYPDNWIMLSVYSPHDYYSHFGGDRVPMVKDHFQGSRWMIQSIMRGCSKLRLFHFPDHEMDMDQIDRVSWSCNELESIRVRIKGLDTKERIEGAINRWKEGRKQKSLGEEIKNPEEKDNSIEARVARHLLQFGKLKMLWLGTNICVL